MSESPQETSNGENQLEQLKAVLKTLPGKPGVYQFFEKSGAVIYVGKAGSLKKRVSSYFSKSAQSPKTRALVANIYSIEFTITRNETEALLLENNLIKSLKPKYNILLRDDKSYPSIFLSTQQDFPRLALHRGPKREKGRYFGPYPNAASARNTLSLLQKVFPVRQCENSFYNNRSRPCLQYQIKRCTAPCVGLISKEQYHESVENAILFLEGKENAAIDQLVNRMETASEALDFEAAALFRDQVTYLRRTQDKQYISGEAGDYDVIASLIKNNQACIGVFYIRNGRNLGNKNLFPKNTGHATHQDVLTAFISQHYLNETGEQRDIPSNILLSESIEDIDLLATALSRLKEKKVIIHCPQRGDKKHWVELAESNAEIALDIHLSDKTNILKRFEALQDTLELDNLPQRVECFDISHTQGEATVASCVVFDTNGPVKSDYRRFNIENITPGDDYAAIKQALERRYKKIREGEALLPDILFVDGGKGQVTQAKSVLQALQIPDVLIIGIAKGPDRKPGLETLIISRLEAGDDQIVNLSSDSPALHLIQNVRDEAHRFAITGHRQRRAKARSKSVLEEIEGLGAKRRQQLLKQFGGLQEVVRAGVEDIARIKGISKQLAQRIYDALH